MKRRLKISNLSLHERTTLLRAGNLSAPEIADFVADAGRQNFLEVRSDIEALLDHADPMVRYTAMSTLAYEWGACQRLHRIAQILVEDPDKECRRQAAGALGSLLRETNDASAAALLAQRALSAVEATDVRNFAYCALLDVLGVPRSKQPSPLLLNEREYDRKLLLDWARS